MHTHNAGSGGHDQRGGWRGESVGWSPSEKRQPIKSRSPSHTERRIALPRWLDIPAAPDPQWEDQGRLAYSRCRKTWQSTPSCFTALLKLPHDTGVEVRRAQTVFSPVHLTITTTNILNETKSRRAYLYHGGGWVGSLDLIRHRVKPSRIALRVRTNDSNRGRAMRLVGASSLLQCVGHPLRAWMGCSGREGVNPLGTPLLVYSSCGIQKGQHTTVGLQQVIPSAFGSHPRHMPKHLLDEQAYYLYVHPTRLHSDTMLSYFEHNQHCCESLKGLRSGVLVSPPHPRCNDFSGCSAERGCIQLRIQSPCPNDRRRRNDACR